MDNPNTNNNILSAEAIFDKYAALYQEKYMDISHYHDLLDIFCSRLKTGSAVLDIACGPGNITHYLLDKRPDLQIWGIDLSLHMLDLARKNNPTARFSLLDARAIHTINEKFEGIVCGFCLPYLNRDEVHKLIIDAADLLNTGGVFYLSTMEDDYEKSRIVTSSTGDRTFMYFHQAADLAAAMNSSGLQVTDVKRQPVVGKEDEMDLIMLALKLGEDV